MKLLLRLIAASALCVLYAMVLSWTPGCAAQKPPTIQTETTAKLIEARMKPSVGPTISAPDTIHMAALPTLYSHSWQFNKWDLTTDPKTKKATWTRTARKFTEVYAQTGKARYAMPEYRLSDGDPAYRLTAPAGTYSIYGDGQRIAVGARLGR